MGTEFDEFSKLSHHGNLDISKTAYQNRLILLGIMTDSGWDFTSSYQRTQNKEYGYNDAFNFGVNYISRKNIEYAMFLDNSKVFIDYKRKINGFDITFGSNYSLMSAILDYDAILKVSSKF